MKDYGLRIHRIPTEKFPNMVRVSVKHPYYNSLDGRRFINSEMVEREMMRIHSEKAVQRITKDIIEMNREYSITPY
ncbi:hypothetical protein N9Y47_00685 [Flavobacteriaceae bacterium]|jgi:hypothetical protein|nr:hypothetical protein [Flavobacteriaceae bacterium]MDB2695098.1 hypothetical protein [Flavobacteriaceae bacterium]|tara:strand:- start:272 stop:499 length:228 start_codon:yes stop_codon:yes gene_type:complete